jgi:hypothetical protein
MHAANDMRSARPGSVESVIPTRQNATGTFVINPTFKCFRSRLSAVDKCTAERAVTPCGSWGNIGRSRGLHKLKAPSTRQDDVPTREGDVLRGLARIKRATAYQFKIT